MDPLMSSSLTFPEPKTVDLEEPLFINSIQVAHPAWPEDQDLFMNLGTVDSVDRTACHLKTVWLACAIVAGNAFTGYLSRSRDPSAEPISLGDQELLRWGKYWFHVPDPDIVESATPSSPYLYPICCSFRDWWYPHGHVPQWWPHSDLKQREILVGAISSTASQLIHGRDRICRVTGHITGTQVAHICPQSENDWFLRNSMDMYLQNGIQNSGNMILLRADIHQAFDNGDFVLVPKQNEGFVIHFLNFLPDLLVLHNNQRLHLTPWLNGHCLFVRFAWAIFKNVRRPGTFKLRIWTEGRTYIELGSSSEVPPGTAEHPKTGKQHGKRTASSGPKDLPRKQPKRAAKTGERAQDNTHPREHHQASVASCDVTSRMQENSEQSLTSKSCPLLSPFSAPARTAEILDHGSGDDEEDRRVMRKFKRVCPDLREVQHPSELDPELLQFYNDIVIYPGQRRIERIKEVALRKQRPEGYNSLTDDAETMDFEREP
ncbi:hypothetical protein PRK78_001645 [Emydomyces testavorans]|uniref:HNH nuclease domain-containing protein n=1 Tax=Emydomyces testavorans TaxID=2070801 RepID=A0AAF0DD87_9EURO|nr:hypothetical protein PRK78_001645 [Emydomyces testavorans]